MDRQNLSSTGVEMVTCINQANKLV